MKTGSRAVAILLLAILAMLVLFALKKPTVTPGNNPAPGVSTNPSANSSPGSAGSGTPAEGSGASPGAVENLAARAGALAPPPAMETNVPPLILMQNARRAIIQYAQVFGGNPVGTNPEITAALMGDNPKHINFITPDSGLVVNEKGEMLDAWGIPFFFHQISGHEMEIHSAGPDHIMWTFDDIVVR